MSREGECWWGGDSRVTRLPSIVAAEAVDALQITKAVVRLPGGDTDHFNIVVGVLQENILARYSFIICLDKVLQTSICPVG